MIGDPSAAIPEELLPLLHDLATGDLKSLALVGETQDGTIKTMYQLNMHDGESNEFAVLGALEYLKQAILLGLEDEDE